MEARGTGSDPASNFNIAWIGEQYPSIINRLDFDQKHTGSAVIDTVPRNQPVYCLV